MMMPLQMISRSFTGVLRKLVVRRCGAATSVLLRGPVPDRALGPSRSCGYLRSAVLIGRTVALGRETSS
jgi:hypothetical protein